jgi:mono/diheme cytochrome c family protein
MFDVKLRSLPLTAVVLSCMLAACGEDADPTKPDGDGEGEETRKPDARAPRNDGGNGKDGGTGGGKDATTAKPDATAALMKLPCEIESIVTEKCGTCHGPDPVAPVSLASLADFQATGSEKRAMYTSVKDKINTDVVRDKMPPAGYPELTDEEMATMNAWLDKGAPSSTSSKACTDKDNANDAGAGDAGTGPYVPPSDDDLVCYKMLAHNGDGKTPMNVGIANDVYYAFVFAAPWKETAYGIVVRSIVDNKKALHHWLLFQDLAPGIPGGAVPQIGAHPTGQLIAAWAPGADPMDFRQLAKDEGGVGLELPSNTTYTMEYHYNSSDPAAKDASGVEVCVAKQKPKNIAAYSWVGFDNLGFPSTKWQGTCRPLTREPIHIVSFMPHMHLKGIHMKGTVNRVNGTKEVVHDQAFNFDYQKSYPVDVVLQPGDSITTDCTYSEPAVFGQPTNMEMCYLFSMAYPKGALAAPDAWGTIAHGASSCLGQ